MKPTFSRVLLAIASAVLMAGALYSALWIFSSTDLAFVPCDGHFSLFAQSSRCRQPYIAMLLTVALFLASLLTMYLRARIGSESRNPNTLKL
jgi:hypothetical protein